MQIPQQHLNRPIEKDIQKQSQSHIGAFHQATISETTRQTQGKYEWNTSQGDPLQISQQRQTHTGAETSKAKSSGLESSTETESSKYNFQKPTIQKQNVQ